jgi:hypothetical protein
MRFLLALFALACLYAQSDPSPEALLDAIRQKMRQNLSRLPDYTCRLNIQRSAGVERARRLQPVDNVHIDVGYLNGKELYAWPGQKFEDVKLEEMLPAGGAVGTGDFGLHIKGIFLSEGPSFTYTGRGTDEGRQVIQFQYRVPRAKSRYVLRTAVDRDAVVGYRGSFSVDANTLLLERLEVILDDIPRRTRVRRAGSILTYAVTRIGDVDFLLPHTSELFIVDEHGRERRNLTRFEQCHKYSGESVVSFEEVAPTGGGTPQPVTELHLPTGLLVEMILRTTLDGTRAAIGDPISAVVSHDSNKAGETVIPKGAKVTGRITRISQVTRGRVVYQVVGLRLLSVEFAGGKAQFAASLESVAMAAAQTEVGPGSHPSEALLFVKGNSLHIPPGAHMIWRTVGQ